MTEIFLSKKLGNVLTGESVKGLGAAVCGN